MFGALLILAAVALAAFLAFSPRLRGSESWRATVTPLASIMGSGFLVSAPLLAGRVGLWALPSMGGLLVLAYLVGGALRFNIRHFEPVEQEHGAVQSLALLSRVVLAAAYFVSVSYYLQLLSAFVLDSLGVPGEFAPHLLTTALLGVIGAIGIWRGLQELEQVETFAVSLNLGVIGALLLALLWHNGRLLAGGDWQLPAVDSGVSGADLRVLLGLLIVVQGFETSRYLGSEHPAELRVRTMRRAQVLSSLIYVLFVGGATVLFHDGLGADVTAILGMTRPLSPVLPVMLAVAAVGSQFSAAVADTAGAGGLISDLSGKRVTPRHGYALILAVTVVLTWETNVNGIIAYASRAFALFYCLQCAVAAGVAWGQTDAPRRVPRAVGFGLLAGVCLAVFALGIPSE